MQDEISEELREYDRRIMDDIDAVDIIFFSFIGITAIVSIIALGFIAVEAIK